MCSSVRGPSTDGTGRLEGETIHVRVERVSVRVSSFISSQSFQLAFLGVCARLFSQTVSTSDVDISACHFRLHLGFGSDLWGELGDWTPRRSQCGAVSLTHNRHPNFTPTPSIASTWPSRSTLKQNTHGQAFIAPLRPSATGGAK